MFTSTIRRLTLSALAAGLAGSCATSLTEPPLTAEALLVEPYARANAQPFDVAAYFGALPGWLRTSYDGARFDPATGAMVVENLFIAFADAPDYGLRVDRADIWGGDAQALAAVLAGEADSPAALFDRLAFAGVTSEGLQWENGAQSLAVSFDKLVFDGLEARSFALAPREAGAIGTQEDAAAAGLIDIARTLAGASKSYALDGAAYSGMSLRLNESQGAEIFMTVAEGFVRGYEGGRTDYERVAGFTMTTRAPAGAGLVEVAQRIGRQAREPRPEDKILQPWMREEIDKALQNPIAFIAANAGGLTSVREIDLIEVRGADLSGALEWLTAWRLPPVTETDLIDLGALSFVGSREIWNGREIVSVARTEIPSADFYWLIPSNFEQIDEGFRFSVLDAVDMMADQFGVGDTADTGAAELAELREALVSLGLDTVTGDGYGKWSWDGETGGLDTKGAYSFTDLFDTGAGLRLAGPSLVQWDALIREGALGDEIARRISFAGFDFNLRDEQLLDKAFAFAAGRMGATGEGAAADLRQSAPAMLRLGGSEANGVNPRIAGYIDALATFLAEGGSLEVTAAPAEPVSFATIQETGENAPKTLPDVLNIVVTHEPAQQ